MRRLSLLFAIACLASLTLTVSSAVAFHGHWGWGGYGYGCGSSGGYGGYGAYYGGFYGPRTAYYSGSFYSSGPYYSGPIDGPIVYSQPYRFPAYYGQPYYTSPIVGQPYASTPVYGSVQGTYSSAQGTTAMYPPASTNGQVRTTGYEAPPTTIAVTIQDDTFQPASLNVQPGTVVRWTNSGTHNHTISAQDNSWDSGDLGPGGTYSLRFQHPGTYYYFCRHHAGMQGTITVGSASAPAPAQPGASSLEARAPGSAPARNY